MSELDDPVGASLHGAHAGLARRVGRVVGYPADVATFCALPADPGPADWADLAALVGPGGLADLFTAPGTPPADWGPVFAMPGRQLVAPAPTEDVDPRVVELGRDDDAAMLDLATRTRPGPFFTRTARLGTFLGVRDGEGLVAMAGQRLHPGGWVEISAVCTDERARGRGLGAVLVAAQVARTAADGGRAFLHVLDTNTGARALYARLGFTERRPVVFRGFRVPG